MFVFSLGLKLNSLPMFLALLTGLFSWPWPTTEISQFWPITVQWCFLLKLGGTWNSVLCNCHRPGYLFCNVLLPTATYFSFSAKFFITHFALPSCFHCPLFVGVSPWIFSGRWCTAWDLWGTAFVESSGRNFFIDMDSLFKQYRKYRFTNTVPHIISIIGFLYHCVHMCRALITHFNGILYFLWRPS